MRLRLLMVFLVTAAVRGGAPIERNWAYLPALRETPLLGIVAVPRPLDESAICLVGTGTAGPEASPPSGPVLALSIGVWRALDGALSRFPPDARWPDAGGRIALPLPPSAPKASGIRNPWEIRLARAPAERNTAIECGGTIIGGDGGPVAIVNGRNVRRGDTLGEFRVVMIRPEGVLLERRGSFIVVPAGRRAVVAVAGD
ncbi:MAG TPA: hypothetical protein VGF85_10980 [Opitutaceae bacterium]|jgi:hypothetical protein